jgi:ActR/RegA family two-component response regulator
MAAVVMLVEDDDAMRDSLARLLKSRGYAVVPLATARDCLTVLDFLKPTFVVIDFKLPDGDAHTLIQRARERAPKSRTVLISGYAEAAVFAAGSSLPFLAKPVDIDALVQAFAA